MDSPQLLYENELIEALAECFCVAAEFIDAEAIIRCIKAALDSNIEHHSNQFEIFTSVKNSIAEL